MRTAAIWLVFACALAAGCDRPEAPPGRSPRIITFAPHATQIALDLGLEDHIVAVTVHCRLPAGMSRPAVGDGFELNREAARLVRPDIVFCNSNEAQFAQALPGVMVVRMENASLAKLYQGIRAMGDHTGRAQQAEALVGRIQAELARVSEAVADRGRPRVLFVLGTEKPTAVGAGWTVSELIEIAGGRNAAAEVDLRGWGTINLETVLSIQPDVLICQVEGGLDSVQRAREYWLHWPELKAVRDGRLIVTDDASLTIEDSRVGDIARKLAEMIHPGALAPAPPATGGAQ